MSWFTDIADALDDIALALQALVELRARELGVPSPLAKDDVAAEPAAGIAYTTDAASQASEQALDQWGREPAALPGPPIERPRPRPVPSGGVSRGR